jgi:hypothetical protein
VAQAQTEAQEPRQGGLEHLDKVTLAVLGQLMQPHILVVAAAVALAQLVRRQQVVMAVMAVMALLLLFQEQQLLMLAAVVVVSMHQNQALEQVEVAVVVAQ